MNIQPLLLDVIKYVAVGKIETITVVASPSGTMQIKTFDPDRELIITGSSILPQEFSGEFGLHNFKILKGLLGMANFQTDDAKVEVGSRKLPDGSTVPDRIDFKGQGSRATFRLMSSAVLPDQPEIGNIPWDVSMELSPSKLAEFNQMANLYQEIDPLFGLRNEENRLMVDFGNNSSSTHSGSMTLLDDCPVQITGELTFKIDKFLLMLKTASGAKAHEVKLCSRGLLGIRAVTDHCSYDYMLKKNM